MGICCSAFQSSRNIDNVHDLDKIIILSHAFMKDKLNEEQIKEYFSSLLLTQLTEEKLDEIKTRRFFKWIDMSTTSKQIPLSIDINHIINLFKKQKSEEKNKLGEETPKEIIFKNQGLSYTEDSLRNYYLKNKITFERRVIKAPPGVFRWLSWMIICKLPQKRDSFYYEKLLVSKIRNKKKFEILLEIESTIESKGSNTNEIKSSLFRLLKSLIIIDHEIIFLKGISYILAYLLIITDIDELNIYYFMVSLLSKTFSDKFGLRGLYIKDQPLLKACISVFQKNLNKYFPELSEHFQEINLSIYSWISLWIQMCYINVFPNYLLLRVWDYFLIHGISFLLNLGLSIIEYFYEDLINNDKPEEILEFFKKLNPNLKSSYKIMGTLDYNIEDLISNSIKNYTISNDEIERELLILYPNYKKFNIKYEYKDNNHKRESLSSLDYKNQEIYNKYISEYKQTENDDDTNSNYYSLMDISSDYCNILEENNNENIELSISQNNRYYEICYTESSCEEIEIEDENNYINEHIKDLINKQTLSNNKSNCKSIKSFFCK